VDGIFGVLGDALAVLVLGSLEERVARFVFVRDSRFTTKHGVVCRAIAGKATGALLDGTVDEIFGVLGDALAVLVLVNLKERVARFVFVCESRFTTKHGGAVVVDRSLAGKATDASMDDTIDGIVGVRVDVLAVLVLGDLVEE